MKIAVLTNGTRGDVEPVVALARELRRQHHRVHIIAPMCYKSFIESNGLGFFELGTHPREVLRSPTVRAALTGGDMEEAFRLLAPTAQLLASGSFDGAVRGTAGSELLVATPMCMRQALCVAELRSLPLAVLALAPVAPSCVLGEIVAAGHGLLDGAAPAALLASHAEAAAGSWETLRPCFDGWRQRLGLCPVTTPFGIDGLLHAAGIPVICAYATELVPRPSDYPKHVWDGAALFLDTPETSELRDAGLAQWLEAGPPPVLVSFGSMPVSDAERLSSLAQSLGRQAGVRVLLVTGWTDVPEPLPTTPTFMAVAQAPYRALLPRCAAAVHHCGAGTAAAVARAGLPSVPCFVCMDQAFWARCLFRAGVAAPPQSFASATADSLAHGLRLALAPDTVRRASELGAALRARGSGCERVASLVVEAAKTGPLAARVGTTPDAAVRRVFQLRPQRGSATKGAHG